MSGFPVFSSFIIILFPISLLLLSTPSSSSSLSFSHNKETWTQSRQSYSIPSDTENPIKPGWLSCYHYHHLYLSLSHLHKYKHTHPFWKIYDCSMFTLQRGRFFLITVTDHYKFWVSTGLIGLPPKLFLGFSDHYFREDFEFQLNCFDIWVMTFRGFFNYGWLESKKAAFIAASSCQVTLENLGTNLLLFINPRWLRFDPWDLPRIHNPRLGHCSITSNYQVVLNLLAPFDS